MTQALQKAAQRVQIINQKGLHARPSGKIAKLAARFEATVTVTVESNSANARSIMDLLLLCAFKGSDVELIGEGPDAAEAVTAIASLIADGFGEKPEDDVTC